MEESSWEQPTTTAPFPYHPVAIYSLPLLCLSSSRFTKASKNYRKTREFNHWIPFLTTSLRTECHITVAEAQLDPVSLQTESKSWHFWQVGYCRRGKKSENNKCKILWSSPYAFSSYCYLNTEKSIHRRLDLFSKQTCSLPTQHSQHIGPGPVASRRQMAL